MIGIPQKGRFYRKTMIKLGLGFRVLIEIPKKGRFHRVQVGPEAEGLSGSKLAQQPAGFLLRDLV